MFLRLLLSLAAIVAVAHPVLHAQPNDTPTWHSGFSVPGIDGMILTLAVDGNDLYVGGWFSSAGAIEANNIARWNGASQRWESLGKGLRGYVQAIVVSGSDVYAGGTFDLTGDDSAASHVARWNGERWLPLGPGIGGSPGCGGSATVSALAIAGDELYVGGAFLYAGEYINTGGIACWNIRTEEWSKVGTGLKHESYGDGFTKGLTVSGDTLYAGGNFDHAGGIEASNVAAWDLKARRWYPLGNGIAGGEYPSVWALGKHNGRIIVAGWFTTAGSLTARNVASFDPASGEWVSLGSGAPANTGLWIESIAVHDTDLFVAGSSGNSGPNPSYVARWNSSSWISVPGGIIVRDNSWTPSVHAMAWFDDRLVAGGQFSYAGSTLANNLGAWTPAGWTTIPATAVHGLDGPVRALLVHKGEVYAGGNFVRSGSQTLNGIARWDGTGWKPLGSGVSGTDNYSSTQQPIVYALAADDDYLYAGGTFYRAGGLRVNCLARWSFSEKKWSRVGAGLLEGYSLVRALAIDGDDLFVGGSFSSIRDPKGSDQWLTFSSVARWNTREGAWHGLDGGVPWDDGRNTYDEHGVRALVVDGDRVYVGGSFPPGGTDTVGSFAIWNRATGRWERTTGGVHGTVDAIMLADGGVYVGGRFDSAAGKPAFGMAFRSNEGSWSVIDTAGSYPADIKAITIKSDGLYAGCPIGIKRWDGRAWSDVSGTFGGTSPLLYGSTSVLALASDSATLYAGGIFTTIGGVTAYGFGIFGPPFTPPTSDITDQEREDETVGMPYPNPTGGAFSIPLALTAPTNVTVRLVTPLGEVVAIPVDRSLDGVNVTLRMELAGLPAGVYLARITVGDRTYSRTIVRTR